MDDYKPPVQEGWCIYDELGPTDLPVVERNIFGAVIQRAILDYMNTTDTERAHRRTAKVFLFSDNPHRSPLRLYAEWLFTNPDAFIKRLRRELRKGTLSPKQVACFTC